MVQTAMMTGFLAWCSFHDCRKQTIPLWGLLLGFAAAALFRVLSFLLHDGREMWTFGLAGMLPGVFLWIISHFGGGIGKADGWMFLVTGLLLGFEENLTLLWITLLETAAFGGWEMIRKKGKRTGMPMAPFILAGFLLMRILGRR